MNEDQNVGEDCAFLQWDLAEDIYAVISEDIKSISLHMYYCIVIFKNLTILTGMHLHRSLFSTCNLQLHRKRDTSIHIDFGEFCEIF